ncbi:Receptor-like serine/threonine-protein kinase ALE2 [Linum grandiflorum]
MPSDVSFQPPLPNISPPPETLEGNVAPMPSNSSGGPPLPNMAPPPQISAGDVAPMPSTNSSQGSGSVVPSTHGIAPPPLNSPGQVAPTPSGATPADGIVPSPPISQGHVAPTPSGESFPLVPPMPSVAPPPQISQVHVSPIPSTSPGGVVSAVPPVHSLVPPSPVSQGQVAPAPSETSGGNGSLVPPPNSVAPPPQNSKGKLAPPPSNDTGGTVLVPPSNDSISIAPPPQIIQGAAAPVPSNDTPASVPAPPTKALPSLPEHSTPSAHEKNMSFHGSPLQKPEPVALPPRTLRRKKPAMRTIAPAAIIPSLPPVQSPVGDLSHNSSRDLPAAPVKSPPRLQDPDVSSPSSTPGRTDWKRDGIPVTAPSTVIHKPLPSRIHSPTKASFPAVAPSEHRAIRHSNKAPAPRFIRHHSSANSPSTYSHKKHNARGGMSNGSPASSYVIPPHSSEEPALPPSSLPITRRTHFVSPPRSPGPVSPSHHSTRKPDLGVPPVPSPSIPILPPKDSPSSPSKSPMPFLPTIHALPPPPPNQDCSVIVCMEPYANTPPGSPCGCVLPMQVGLRLSVSLYTFFPLVSELAQEIAAGVFMKQSQVRIMGANAASQEPEKTIVLIDLVPLGQKFDNTTALLTFQRFWLKQVAIQASFFGDYEVLYVKYPGLPSSPPSSISGITIIDDGPYSGNGNNARTIKPLGVDVSKRKPKDGLGGSMIAIIALSASIVVIMIAAAAWIFLLRNRGHGRDPTPTSAAMHASVAKPLGTVGSALRTGLSSNSLSFGSSITPYTGSAKTFSASDIERATNNFDLARTLGEGGFGRVYSGVLEDGTQIAVKVLKRDDQQGGREFLAEVEMLSRLHHRNLVKLIGICTEESARCLVYELVPNGSVESHLHGDDAESAPLDWDVRIKIALGAARGLAYLHEDSSPRVIHRDFKSSNILLESDYTPKVSDFGLARSALDEETSHISTRVMGTFGYVAPEYAMTGHLLVKSDVYSYGVVLLELLTGRKPVDMSQPAGEENLVAWARPLLTSTEGLQTMIDPSLCPDVPFDSVAKVAAIASMCVQPEVSHRPFMGEVVQALKLVSNECDEAKEGNFSQDLSLDNDMDGVESSTSGQGHPEPNYDSDIERGVALSDMFGTSERFGQSASFRRYSSSGPLRPGKGREWWQRMRRLRGESVSEHGVMFRQWASSY